MTHRRLHRASASRGVRLTLPALAAVVMTLLVLPAGARAAAAVNLATLSCNKYENEILPAAGSDSSGGAKSADSINTVMWLFGYSVARSGDHVMYGDALTSFGFALDAECKNQPSMSLLEALSQVSPKRSKPMDLDGLSCASFEARHAESQRSDPESATTIIMWLFGFSVGLSGGHLFDAAALDRFENDLKAQCTERPDQTLYEGLKGLGKQLGRH
jgi:hypothetical protein